MPAYVADHPLSPDGRCNDPDLINACAAQFGLAPPTKSEVQAGRAIAAMLINPNISDEDDFERVQSITGCSLFRYLDDGVVRGLLSFFLVNEAGLAALEDGRFNAVHPDAAYIAKPHTEPAGAYAWGIAATSREGAKAIMSASAYMLQELFWSLPFYSRVATEDGKQAMIGSLGFQPVADDDTGLVVLNPRSRVRASLGTA